MPCNGATLVVGQKVHIGLKARTDHIDVLGPEARGDNEAILPGHEIHQRRAGADDATGGRDPQVGHHAVPRRSHRRAQELVVGRLQSLAKLKYLVLCLAQ